MTISRQQLYALGEAFGESATHRKPGGRVYGGGGSGGGGTSTTLQSIPDELKPLASAYTNKAINLSNQGYQPYGGQRYEDLNTTQNLGIGMTQNRALYGDSTVNAGRDYLQNSLSSGPQQATANPYAQQQNPYLDAMVNKAQANVLGNARAADMRSGSFGNSGVAEQAARQMGDVATNMYGGAYNNQAQLAEAGAGRNDAMLQNYRSNNLNAAQLGLNYGNQAYQDAGQLMRAGQIQQDQNQQNRDFNYSQFQDASNLPYKQLSAMSGVFGSNLGNSSTTTQSGGGGK